MVSGSIATQSESSLVRRHGASSSLHLLRDTRFSLHSPNEYPKSITGAEAHTVHTLKHTHTMADSYPSVR